MEPYQLLCLLWVAELAGTATVDGASFAGPYLVYADRFVKYEDDQSNNNIVLEAHISPFNNKQPYSLQAVSGNLSFKYGFDDTYWSRTGLDARSSDGHRWLKNAFIFNFPAKACSNWREQMPGFSPVLLGDALPPPGKPCIVKPGTYTFENVLVNWTVPNVPIMPYGFVRFRQTAGRGRDTEFSAMAEAHIIPRPKPGNNG